MSEICVFYSGIKAPYVTLGMRGAHKAMSTRWALACDRAIGCSDNTNQSLSTTDYNIVRLLKKARGIKEFKVGIVSNTHIAHATPAASYALSDHRLMYDRVAKQLSDAVYDGVIDVMLSGGNKWQNLIDRNSRDGKVRLVTDKKGLRSVNLKHLKKNNKLVGLFEEEELNWIDKRRPDEPSLPELADKAVKLLRNGNKNGFFLMVEGGNIDRAHHKNFGLRSVREMAEFDTTIEKVVSELTPEEKAETLIIVTGLI